MTNQELMMDELKVRYGDWDPNSSLLRHGQLVGGSVIEFGHTTQLRSSNT